MDLDALFDAHDDALKAARNHQTIAKSLIRRGLDILQKETLTPENYSKASAALDRGVKMEQEANQEVLRLLENAPRR